MVDYLVEKPFLTILKIFGLGPYTQTESNFYRVSKNLSIYFVIVIIYNVLLQNTTFYEYISDKQDFQTIFLQAFQFIDYFGFSLSCCFSAIILFRKRFIFCEALNKIIKLNHELKNFDGTLQTSKSFFCMSQFGLLLLVNIIRSLYLIIHNKRLLAYLILLFAFSTLCQILLMDLFFTFLILNIKNLFRNLNIITEKILKERKIEKMKLGSGVNILADQIIFIKKLHKEIYFTVSNINEECSDINVMSMAYSATVLIYSPFVSRHWDGVERILSSVFWIAFFLMKMLLVLYVCTETTKEVNFKWARYTLYRD